MLSGTWKPILPGLIGHRVACHDRWMDDPNDTSGTQSSKSAGPAPAPLEIPEAAWDDAPEELRAHLSSIAESMRACAATIASIPETRDSLASASMLIVAENFGRFDDGLPFLPDIPPGVEHALDRQREDAKAGLVAFKVEHDKAMWRLMWEHTERQRVADRQDATRQRSEDRQEAALRRAEDVKIARRNLRCAVAGIILGLAGLGVAILTFFYRK